jgi:D-alanyl-D-alanine carboxypeptidase
MIKDKHRIFYSTVFSTLLLGLASVQTVPAAAQSTATAAPLQANEVEALGRTLVAAINGTSEQRAAWIDAHISDGARKQDRAKTWKAFLDGLRPRYGLLTYHGATAGGSAVSVGISASGTRRSHILLAMSQSEPNRVGQIRDYPFPKALDVASLPERLSVTDARKAISDHVEAAARSDDFSGAILIMKGDEILFQKASGFAEWDFQAPNNMATRYHLGSMDKMFTAAAIGQLIEAGKLALDTKLVEVLPDYANAEAAKAITIQHLLTHRAGLGMLFERPAYDGRKPYEKVTELLPAFAAEPLMFAPGERSAYSNEGFVVLGAVIEKLTGQSYYDYVQKNIFDKAGMADTGYPRLNEISPRRAVGYMFANDDPLGLEPRRPNVFVEGYRGNSCGGGYSTAKDMILFLNALRSGRLMSAAMAERMMTAVPESTINRGLGFQDIRIGDDQLRGHDGGGANSGINSFAKMLWKGGYVIAVMGNYDAPFAQQLGTDIATILSRVPAGAK